MTGFIRCLLAASLILSSLEAQPLRPFSQFEVTGGASLLMPREDYHSGWGLGLDGVWNLSPRLGVDIAYSGATLNALESEGTKTVSSLAASLEFTFRGDRYMRSFTSLGIASVTDESDNLFIFGAGIKVPIRQRFLLRMELRDYHRQLGVPFMSFPGSRVAFQGSGGSRYLELGIGIGITLGHRTHDRNKPRAGQW